MFKGFVTGILTSIVLAALCVYFIVRAGVIPANADARPPWLETMVAETSLDATLAREAPKGQNPVPLTDENLIAGVQLYAQHCAFCHGTSKGDKSASPVAKGLYPAPPQLASDGVTDDPESYSFWKLKHGVRWTGMPSWKSVLTDRQIWMLALFLKHMTKLPPAVQAEWEKVQN